MGEGFFFQSMLYTKMASFALFLLASGRREKRAEHKGHITQKNSHFPHSLVESGMPYRKSTASDL
jgi:hypothetical protein